MTGEHAERVAAVVVSYNRAELLGQALSALGAQRRPPDVVLVVDNASTDGSVAVAEHHPLAPELVVLPRNTGGAGGFAVGLAHAVQALGADLVWLMDDDTIPRPDALAELLGARSRFAGPVALLGSRVVWTDGRAHPMNTPRRRPGVPARTAARAEAIGAVPVRSSSFVSMLVDARAVRYHGLPVADYFIWNDDFEYSCRLLHRAVGLLVPSSVVEHRTASFGATDADPGDRFYYEVRNKIWLLTRSRALSVPERALYAGSSLRRWLRTARRSDRRDVLAAAFVRGVRDGVRGGPRPTAEVLAGLGPVSSEVARVEDRARRG